MGAQVRVIANRVRWCKLRAVVRWLVLGVALGAAGCNSSGAQSLSAPPQAAPTAKGWGAPANDPSRPGRSVMLWEGDDSERPLMLPVKWCSEKPCLVTLTAPPKVGRNGTRGVLAHGEGKGSMIVRWSFDRIGNFSPDDALTMWLRVEGRSGSSAPECIWVAIHHKMQRSRQVCLRDCDAKFNDGHDHRIVIPISVLYWPGDGFEPQRVDGISFYVELDEKSHNFDMYVNEIKLEALDVGSMETQCWPQLRSARGSSSRSLSGFPAVPPRRLDR